MSYQARDTALFDIQNYIPIWCANITITNVTTDGEMVVGGTVMFKCTAYVMDVNGTVNGIWKLNNSIINPTSRSKWKTESSQTTELRQFILTVRDLKTSDSGNLTCLVSDGVLESEWTLNLYVNDKPVVRLSPRTTTATQGENVTIYCTVVQSYSGFKSIQWYRNGVIFDGSKGENISHVGSMRDKLDIYEIQRSVEYACSGINSFGEGNRVKSDINVLIPGIVYKNCTLNTDQFGSSWNLTFENTLAEIPCSSGRSGEISRFCNSNGDWEEPDYSKCVTEDLLDLKTQSEFLKNGVQVNDVETILQDLENITESDVLGDLTSGDLKESSVILVNIAEYVNEHTKSLSDDQLEKFVSSCDNLLEDRNRPSWEQLKHLNLEGITEMAEAVTIYTKAYTNINDSVFQRTVQKDQLVVEVGKIIGEDITFPRRTQELPDWITNSSTQVFLDKESIKGEQLVGYSSTYYRNISDLFHEYIQLDGLVKPMTESDKINSVIIDFSIEPTPAKLGPPLVVKFEHLQVYNRTPLCVFWDFDVQALETQNGAWSATGSKLVNTSDSYTYCQFYHTTNFALLMSPFTSSSSHRLVLSTISAVGCGVSIFFLAVTVAMYAVLWRPLTRDIGGKNLKRDQATLLINLCVSLTLSYILFLAGVTRTSDQNICMVIAVLLHYIFLVDFAFMLAEGIEIFRSVYYVLPSKSRRNWLIPACWVCPAVITGISMGATKLEGYGSSKYCWLSVESKLIWAFVGPVLFVTLINIIVLIFVMRVMFGTHAMKTMAIKERAKAGMRSLCVIFPLFGITWIFGVFSVNEDTVLFQYLFAIFNSSQGFFIFLFHVALNVRVREGVRNMRKKKAEKYIVTDQSIHKSDLKDTSFTCDTHDDLSEDHLVSSDANAKKNQHELQENNPQPSDKSDSSAEQHNQMYDVDMPQEEISGSRRYRQLDKSQ